MLAQWVLSILHIPRPQKGQVSKQNLMNLHSAFESGRHSCCFFLGTWSEVEIATDENALDGGARSLSKIGQSGETTGLNYINKI